jgi:hypothetical protein
MSAVDRGLFEQLARRWLPGPLDGEEMATLVAALETMEQGLAAIPDEALRAVEPPLHFDTAGPA